MIIWLRKILYSLRLLPFLFLGIIILLSVRLFLTFTGFLQKEEIFPIRQAIAEVKKDENKKDESKKEERQDSENKNVKEPASESGKEKLGKKPEDKTDEKRVEKEGEQKSSEPPSISEIDESDFSPAKLAVLEKLKNRFVDLFVDLQKREQVLKEQEMVLQTVNHKIEEKYKELEKKKDEIEKLKQEVSMIRKSVSEEDEKKLLSLVKIYQTMKPKDAARIFDQLEMRVLIDVFRRMKEGNSAPILANMNSEKAKMVTLYLAQKRGFPKEEDSKEEKVEKKN